VSGDGAILEDRLENYLVRGLIDFNDVSYDDHAELLYKLAGQVVAHLQSYLSSEDDVKNVLQYYQKSLVELIHAQMVEHFEEKATAYEAHVSKGLTTMKPGTFSVPAGESARPFRTTVDDKLLIKGMLFGGFRKCLYPAQSSIPTRSGASRLSWRTTVKSEVVQTGEGGLPDLLPPGGGIRARFCSRDEDSEVDLRTETRLRNER